MIDFYLQGEFCLVAKRLASKTGVFVNMQHSSFAYLNPELIFTQLVIILASELKTEV